MKPQDRTRAILRSSLPSSQRLVLIAVADYADQHGECWPSQTTLARNTGYTRRTVGKALAALIEAGILTVIGHRSQCHVMRLDANKIPTLCEQGSHPMGTRFAPPAKKVRTRALHANEVRTPCERGSQPPANEVRTEATKEATKEATRDRAAPAPVPKKSKSSKKSKAKRKPAPKVPGYRETIEHWEAATAPWVQAPATRYPWVFHGRNHDGSKIKRWLKASQSLEHLKSAVTRYVAAVAARTTWPKGEPPSTRHFDRELARWLMASHAPAPRDHWMDTGHGVGQDAPPRARLDTSTAQQARAWLDSPEGAALLFIVDQEFGPGPLPDHDHPPRELWLDGQVTHPAVVWAELRRRRSAPPLVVVSS